MNHKNLVDLLMDDAMTLFYTCQLRHTPSRDETWRWYDQANYGNWTTTIHTWEDYGHEQRN